MAGTLHRGNGPEPDSLDPHLAQGLSAANLLRDLFEGLVSEQPDGSLGPGMASHWQVSKDGLHWQFPLREGLRWSDGSALEAAHIVASLQRAVSPATAAPYATQLEAIRGASDILAGQLAPEQLGVHADAAVIHITLSRAEPALPALLSLPVAFPRHPDAGASSDIIGNGAFRLTERVLHSHLTLEVNPYFHARDSLRLSRVVHHITEDPHAELARFRAGELHITETIPTGHYASLRRQYPQALRTAPYLGSHWLGYNLERPPFAGNLALREALSLAINREILVRHITGAGEQAAWSLVPPGLPDYSAPVLSHAELSQAEREQLARQRLRDSGLAEQPPRIEIRYNSHAGQRRLALAVAAMWQEVLGVPARLHNEEWKVFVVNRRERRLTQVFRGGWIADYPDPLSFLELFRSHSTLNATGFADSNYDQLLQQAALSNDPAQRMALLQQAEQRLLQQHAVIPLYFHVSRHLVSPAVGGWMDNPLDRHPSRYLWLQDQ